MGFLQWRGELDWATRRQRVNVALFIVLLGVAAVLTDFSHYFFDPPLYIACLLPLLAIGGLLLGPVGGTMLGLTLGIVRYVHAVYMPLHYYELFPITPLNSIVFITLCGMLWGIASRWVTRQDTTMRERVAPLCVACVLMSAIYSISYASPAFTMGIDTPNDALFGVALSEVLPLTADKTEELASLIATQVAINALYTLVCCLVVQWMGRQLLAFTSSISLRTAFRFFFLVVFAATYLFTISVTFVGISIDEAKRARDAIRSDVGYLSTQIEYLDAYNKKADTFFERFMDVCEEEGFDIPLDLLTFLDYIDRPTQDFLTGYTMENEGTVIIAYNDGVIEYSDDPRLPHSFINNQFEFVESNLKQLLGHDIMAAINTSMATGEITRILYHNALNDVGATDSYSHDTQMGYLLAKAAGDDEMVVIIEPASMVFRDRGEFLVRVAIIAFMLLGACMSIITLLVEHMIVRRIDKTNATLERIAAGNLEARADVEGANELKALSTGINTTIDALNKWIVEAETRMDSELAAARTIQESSLPRKFPPFPEKTNFDIYASMKAAREVGGDFYDFFLIKKSDGHDMLVFMIADVSGKGVPASLLMMKTKTMIRENIMRYMEVEGARAVLETLNQQLAEDSDSDMFVTLWTASIDFELGRLFYINAGHNPPLFRHEGRWVELAKRSGLPLGMRKSPSYKVYSVPLSPGDKLLCYTDGVTEARNADRELFGEARLLDVAAHCTEDSPRALVEMVSDAVEDFAEGTQQADDITLLSVTYSG